MPPETLAKIGKLELAEATSWANQAASSGQWLRTRHGRRAFLHMPHLQHHACVNATHSLEFSAHTLVCVCLCVSIMSGTERNKGPPDPSAPDALGDDEAQLNSGWVEKGWKETLGTFVVYI